MERLNGEAKSRFTSDLPCKIYKDTGIMVSSISFYTSKYIQGAMEVAMFVAVACRKASSVLEASKAWGSSRCLPHMAVTENMANASTRWNMGATWSQTS